VTTLEDPEFSKNSGPFSFKENDFYLDTLLIFAPVVRENVRNLGKPTYHSQNCHNIKRRMIVPNCINPTCKTIVSIRHIIHARPTPWMTAKDPSRGKPAPSYPTVFRQSLQRVGTAGWLVPAPVANPGAEQQTIGADGQG